LEILEFTDSGVPGYTNGVDTIVRSVNLATISESFNDWVGPDANGLYLNASVPANIFTVWAKVDNAVSCGPEAPNPTKTWIDIDFRTLWEQTSK